MYRTVQSGKRTAEPTTARGQRARQKILATAAEMTHVRGVRATSVDEVLAAGGMGKSQFYHYFKSKDDLIREVLAYQLRKLMNEQGPLLENLDNWKGIESWFAFIVDWQRRRCFVGGCPIGNLAAEMADCDDELRSALVVAFDSWSEFLRRGLVAMRARGDLRRDAHPKALAESTLASIQGGLLLAKTRKDVKPLKNALLGALACLRSYAGNRSGRRRILNPPSARRKARSHERWPIRSRTTSV